MPNTQERTDRQPELMSDEELRQLLREDASNLEGEDTDMELILHAMEVLAARRKEKGEGTSPAQAMESFNENYCTSKDHHLISEKAKRTEKKPSARLWKRTVAVAAVLALIVALGAVTASAWNFNLWDVISQWTRETFRFGTCGEEFEQNAENPCASLQEALDDYNITAKLVPTWLPNGYSDSEVNVFETPKQRIFSAQYLCEEQEIIIRITDYLGEDPYQAEQSGTLLEVYTFGDFQYYIFENNQLLHTVWIDDSYECYVQGSLTLDEIKKIIESIEKG